MRIVVTAGPTREYLDPVRFLSNPSTGKMGFAIAAEAARRGHDVTLIAGPVTLKTPKGVKRVDVVSAREMLAAALAAVGDSKRTTARGDNKRTTAREAVLIATAAVADWRPAKCAAKKLKKGEMSGVLKLVRNPDILKTIARQVRGQRSRLTADSKNSIVQPSTFNLQPIYLVGFAAETNDVLKEAARKCREKGLEFIVANDVTQKGCGFGMDTNRVTFVFPDGTMKKFPLMTKRAVAKRILDALSSVATGREG